MPALNTRAMAALDLLLLANDTDELREHVQASFAVGRRAPADGAAAAAADDPRRGRAGARRRRGGCARFRAGDCGWRRSRRGWRCCSRSARWMMSTDEVTTRRGEGAARAPARPRRDERAGGRRWSCTRPSSAIPALADAARANAASTSRSPTTPACPRTARIARAARAAATSCSPKSPVPRRCAGSARAAVLRDQARALGLAPPLLLPAAARRAVGRPARARAHRRRDAGQGRAAAGRDGAAASAPDARRRRARRRARRLGWHRCSRLERIVAWLRLGGLGRRAARVADQLTVHQRRPAAASGRARRRRRRAPAARRPAARRRAACR